MIEAARISSSGQFLCAAATAGNMDIFQWIEAHSTLIDIVKTVVVAIIAFSIWGIRYARERRAAAVLHLYACLRILLKDIEKKIVIVNPYEAVYSEDLRREIARDKNETACPSIDKYLNNYTEVAKRLRDLILNTENNIYPSFKNRKKWYEKQKDLYDFTCFILEKEGTESEKTNKSIANVKKQELKDTITFLLNEIEKVKI